MILTVLTHRHYLVVVLILFHATSESGLRNFSHVVVCIDINSVRDKNAGNRPETQNNFFLSLQKLRVAQSFINRVI